MFVNDDDTISSRNSGKIGNLFEKIKGVTPNSRAESDLSREDGGELKTSNGRTMMTLFTKCPEEKGAVRMMALKYAKDVGHKRKNPTLGNEETACCDMYLIFKCKDYVNDFGMEMDDENKILRLININDSEMPVCTYKYSTLLNKFKKKFGNGATIGYYSPKSTEENVNFKEEHFDEIKSDEDILDLFRNGDVIIEMNVWTQERKNKIYIRDRGVKFRIRKLDQIFKN